MTTDYNNKYQEDINGIYMAGHPIKVEMRFTPSGSPVTKFTVINHQDYKKSDGSLVKRTLFQNCQAWGKLAEAIKGLFDEGGKANNIFVEGVLLDNTWEDNEGKKHYSNVLQVEKFRVIGWKNGTSEQPVHDNPGDFEPTAVDADDIPF